MIKKICLYLLVFIFFISSLNAGKTFELDFNLHNYTLYLDEDDRVAFEFKDSKHTIILDEFLKSSIRLDVFLYLEKKNTPHYVYLNLKQNTMKLDIDRDDINDFVVYLIDLDNKNKKALFRFDKINEPKPFYKNKEQKGGVDLKIFNKINKKILIVSGVVILIILLALISLFIIRKRGNDTYF